MDLDQNKDNLTNDFSSITISKPEIKFSLSESELYYKDLLETLNEAVAISDKNDKLIYVNSQYCEMLGYSQDELLGHSVSSFLSPDFKHIYNLEHIKRKNGKPANRYELTIQKKNGKILYSLISTKGFYEKNGDFRGSIALLTDITEIKEMKENLLENKQKYQQLFESANDAIFIMDKDIFTDCNQKTLEIFGCTSQDQILNHPPYQFSPLKQPNGQNSKELALININNALAGKPQFFEWMHCKIDGTLFPAEVSLNAIDLQGKKYLIAIVRDLSRFKELYLRFKELFKSYPLPTYTWDYIGEDFILVDINEAALNFTYGNLKNYIKTKASVFFKERGFNEIFNKMIESYKNKTKFNHEIEYTFLSTGETKILEVHYAYVPPNSLILHTEDITDRKKAEKALAAEKELLAITLRSIGDGVISTDIAGKIILMNKVAEKLTGFTQEESINRNLSDILVILDTQTGEVYHQLLKENTTFEECHQLLKEKITFEKSDNLLLKDKNNQTIEISIKGSPILNKSSNVIGMVLVFRDITEKRKLEEEILKFQKIESIGILAGGIAHDFNNILTAILGNLSIAKIEIEEGGSNISQIIDETIKATYRANKLTKQLLTFSKGGTPIKKSTSIKELIEETTKFALRGTKSKSFIRIAPDLWNVDVDEGQISQVINNIVINADQAMPNGGNIIIETKNMLANDLPEDLYLKNKYYIQIIIMDQGIGIPKDNIQMVFDPYFTTKQKGSGLGLAVVYSIIKNHGGNIRVDSKLGEGTIFYILLPASEKHGLYKVNEIELLHIGKGKIIIMDDEIHIRKLMRKMLTRLGYNVKITKDGKELLLIFKNCLKNQTQIACIIMDLTIPGGLGGRETIKILRKFDTNVKVIVSSGYSNDPIMSNYKEFGFDGVLVKPFSLNDLSNSLKEILEI